MNGFGMGSAGEDGGDPGSEWLDDMVKRLKTVLEGQVRRVSDADPENAAERAADARTLATLERTLEKLAALERERAAVREKKVAKHGAGARTALERRLDQRLAAIEAATPDRKS